MNEPTDNRITFRAGDALRDWLTSRTERMHTGSPALQARMELDTWRTVLDAELRRIPLTIPEASCIADVLNGYLQTAGAVPIGVGFVYAECYDAFQIARDTPVPDASSYGAKWDLDEAALLAKLQRLGPAADLALANAIARWWAERKDPTADGFTAVGLRIVGG